VRHRLAQCVSAGKPSHINTERRRCGTRLKESRPRHHRHPPRRHLQPNANHPRPPPNPRSSPPQRTPHRLHIHPKSLRQLARWILNPAGTTLAHVAALHCRARAEPHPASSPLNVRARLQPCRNAPPTHARHSERSDPAFSCARLLCAGSRREESLFVRSCVYSRRII
jgi:hypothetical protein